MKISHKKSCPAMRDNLYDKLTTKANVLIGYQEFLSGKRKKRDVVRFEKNKYKNLEELFQALVTKTYVPGGYSEFIVRDPKTRIIHKAPVADRIVHHIVTKLLEEIFDHTFINHSYSSRINKGTHKGVKSLQKMALRVSHNDSRVCWALKCDIKKFFASVNHEILIKIFEEKITDEDFLNLLRKIIHGFYAGKENNKGVPIGNLTSQVFSNIYLNQLDQFVKHTLKVKHYLRYADDFVFLHHDKDYLISLIDPIREFLHTNLDLELHPNKIIIGKFTHGIDFLGYITFPKYVLPRTSTKKRLMKKIKKKVYEYKAGKITKETLNQTIQSYLGFLGHANSYHFQEELKNLVWFWMTE